MNFSSKVDDKNNEFVQNSNSKSLVHTLVDKMSTTFLAKPNFSLYVTLGTHYSEGIEFEQFSTLFDSMEAACNRSLVHFTKYELITEFLFDKHIVGIFTTDGCKPTFVKRYTRSKLLFRNEFNASLQFTLMEVNHSETLENENPLQVQMYEKWTFTHKNKVKYDFLKTVQGKTKEDACNQDPTFVVRMYILHDAYPSSLYTNMLIQKSYDIFGYGPNPNLIHVTSKHNGKRKEL